VWENLALKDTTKSLKLNLDSFNNVMNVHTHEILTLLTLYIPSLVCNIHAMPNETCDLYIDGQILHSIVKTCIFYMKTNTNMKINSKKSRNF
jgi:hypothetical protein